MIEKVTDSFLANDDIIKTLNKIIDKVNSLSGNLETIDEILRDFMILQARSSRSEHLKINLYDD